MASRLLAPPSSTAPAPCLLRERTHRAVRDAPVEALVDCARGGDPDAFQEVVVRFGPPLVRFVMRFTGRGAEFANDVVQDAMIAAWCNLDSIRDARHLRPWLYRVARFKAVDRLRRAGPGGVPMQSLDVGIEMDVEPKAPGSSDPARLADRRRRALGDAVERLLRTLPPAYAGPVRLHYLHGIPLAETARLLGLAKPTVKMRLFRARKRLRRLVGGTGPRDRRRREGDGDGTDRSPPRS